MGMMLSPNSFEQMATITNELPGTNQVMPIDPGYQTGVSGTNTVAHVIAQDSMPAVEARVAVADPRDVLQQDTLIGRYAIAQSDALFVNTLGIYDPFNLWLAAPLVQSHLVGRDHIRGDLKVTMVTTCPGACYGAYFVQALAEGGVRAISSGIQYDDETRDMPWTSTQGEFEVINCEMQNTIQFELPFLAPINSMRTNPALNLFPMWRLLMWPICPLRSSIAPTALGTVLIYASLKPGYAVESRTLQGRKDKLPVPDKPNKGRSVLAGKINSVIGTVTALVPAIAPFTVPFSAGLAMAANFADMFGFTKESMPLMPVPYVRRLFSSTSTIDGTDSSEILALTNANAVTISGAMRGGVDEDIMSFKSLFERWTIVRRIAVSSGTPTGLLYALPVTPMFPAPFLGFDFHTVAGYIGLPFEYWSGSMEYMIYIPSCPNLKGGLQVFWMPRIDAAVSIDPTNWADGTYIDLSGTTKTHVVVDMGAPVVSRSTNIVYDTLQRNTANCNGCLYFYITAPLTAPVATALLEIIIMARGGSDMRFSVPRAFSSAFSASTTSTGPPVTASYRLQGLRVIDPSVNEDKVHFAKAEAAYPVIEIHYGENVESCRALTQKFSFAGRAVLNSYQVGGTIAPSYAMMGFPPVASAPRTTYGNFFPPICNSGASSGLADRPWTWYSHYTMPFTGVAGSSRVKILPLYSDNSLPQINFTVVTPKAAIALANKIPANGQAIEFFPYPSPFPHVYLGALSGRFVESGGVEVTVPYYGPYKYCSVAGKDMNPQPFTATYGTDKRSSAYLLIVPTVGCMNTAGAAELTAYVASGPDISVPAFRRIPGVVKQNEW